MMVPVAVQVHHHQFVLFVMGSICRFKDEKHYAQLVTALVDADDEVAAIVVTAMVVGHLVAAADVGDGGVAADVVGWLQQYPGPAIEGPSMYVAAVVVFVAKFDCKLMPFGNLMMTTMWLTKLVQCPPMFEILNFQSMACDI